MNYTILSKVIEELSSLLPGARIDRVFEGAEKEIIIIFRKAGKNYVLLISPDRSLPRVHLVVRKPAAAQGLHPFTQFLKSRMAGGRFMSIGLLNRDRVAEIRFTRDGAEYGLVFEIIRPGCSLVMTGDAGMILAVYHPATPEGRSRPLAPGILYEPPEKKGTHFFDNNESDMENRTGGKAHERTGPVSANREAEVYYDGLLKQRRQEQSKNSLRGFIKKLFRRAERKWEAVSADQKAANAAEEYRRAGDLILANRNSLRAGISQADLADYDGSTVRVPLDPKRSPAGNAEQYFKKYKKAKSGRDIIAVRLRETGEEKLFFQSLLSDVEKAADEGELLSVQSKLLEKGYLRVDGKKKVKSDANAAHQAVRKILFQGWEIMVGKNSAGNDHITAKIAGADDLWLHAEGLPGSHVLVRNPEKRDIPAEVVKKAASLAAFYSKGRTAGKTAVTFTPARYVKKPKGAKPGLVTLSKRRTIMVEPEKE